VINQIDAPTLAAELQSGRSLLLLDVREPWEFDVAKIEGAINIPMSSIPNAVDDIRERLGDDELVVICHHGMRSMQVARFLAANGFDRLINLSGGVDAWSRLVDQRVPSY
jgi:rhodanese-related sulfurtransferase